MRKPNFAHQLWQFYRGLQPLRIPRSFAVLYPYSDPVIQRGMKSYFQKYYADTNKRTLLLGINPGRLGAGATGINFTAPLQLKDACGISHPLYPQTELSATFIYDMIHAFGGVKKFTASFFISAVSPLGFTYRGVNCNYYDHPGLLRAVTPFILQCLSQQMEWNINRETCICIGEGKNYQFLQQLNRKQGWFKTIIPLPHPRFILQYRRKKVQDYIQRYLTALDACR